MLEENRVECRKIEMAILMRASELTSQDIIKKYA